MPFNSTIQEIRDSDIRVKVALLDGFKEYQIRGGQKVIAKNAVDAKSVLVGDWVWKLTPNYTYNEGEINRVLCERLMADEALEILMTCDSAYEKCVAFLYKQGVLDSLHAEK